MPVMPEEAAALAAVRIDPKAKELPESELFGRVHDVKSSDKKFDLSLPFGSAALVAHALEDMPHENHPALGLEGLATVWAEMQDKDPIKNALWYARAGLLRAIELRILATRAQDVDGGALRPRERAYVDEMIASLPPAAQAIERLARTQ